MALLFFHSPEEPGADVRSEISRTLQEHRISAADGSAQRPSESRHRFNDKTNIADQDQRGAARHGLRRCWAYSFVGHIAEIFSPIPAVAAALARLGELESEARAEAAPG